MLVEDEKGVANALIDALGAHGRRLDRCWLGADARE